MFGLRRNNSRWGIVYDSVSKEPLDPAIVQLVDAHTGRITQTSITDMSGRYNFLAYPGKFKILAKKSNYNCPSVISAGDHDEIYRELYHGEFFELSGDSEVIPFNIPMDPVGADWNQKAKRSMMGYHLYAENFLYRLASLLFWFCLLPTLAGFYFRPSPLIYGFMGFYVLVFLLVAFTPRPRWWGTVSLRSGEIPGDSTTLELSYSKMPSVTVAKANLYEDGKFFLRLDPGSYLLQIKDHSERGHGKVLYQKKVKVGLEQVLNGNFVI